MTQSSEIRQALETLGILGEYINFQDPARELKKEHRKLAAKYHPDRCKDTTCEDKFIDIQSSYEKLEKLSKEEILGAINDNPLTRLTSCVKKALQDSEFPNNLTEEQLRNIIKIKNIYCPNLEDDISQPAKTYAPQQAKQATAPKSNEEILMECLKKHLPNTKFPDNLTEEQLVKFLDIKNIPCPGYNDNSQTAKPSNSKATPKPATQPKSNNEIIMECIKQYLDSEFPKDLTEKKLVEILDAKHIPCPGYDREAAEKENDYQRSQDDFLNSHDDGNDDYVPLSGVDE